MPNRDVYTSRPAQLRDFSGGWDVADNPHNLSTKFATLSDNVVVGVDGSISPRYGYKLHADLKKGTETSYSVSATFTTTNGSSRIRINWTAHPFNSGDHLTINSISGTIANITTQPTGTYGVVKFDANNFDIYIRELATGTATSAAFTLNCVRDTHVLGGNIIELAYFQGYMLVFTDIGEIVSVGASSNVLIWNHAISLTTSGNPVGWRKMASEVPLKHISFDTFKQTLICVNGRLNDKPLEIDLTRATPVQYLVDPATGSNLNVYSAEFVIAFGGYVLLVGSNNTSTPTSNKQTTVDISAKNTSAVFVGNPSPSDSVQIDLGRVTQTIEPRITGVGNIRNKLFVGFYDSAMLGELGKYTSGGIHDPDFSDQVPLHGCINHRVLVNLGNDLLLCDYAGVPAFSQSQIASTITPERISQLIDPELNKHLSRLSDETIRYNCFALWNIRDRQYMLFIPKYDSSSVFTSTDPIYTTTDLANNPAVLVYAPSHPMSAGDYVDVSGATSMSGLAAASINGRQRITAVVNSDYFIMSVSAVPSIVGQTGGGTITFTPVNDENVGYIFCYNTQLKIRRWTRFRSLSWKAGTVSKEGRVFFATNSRIYEFGTSVRQIYADGVGDYTYQTFANNFAYSVGTVVYDSTDGRCYNCLVAHTSLAVGNFSAERAAYATYWEEFTGYDVSFQYETPWSDFGDRQAVKVNKQLRLDAQGQGSFTLSTYVDNLYQDSATYELTPSTSMDFIAEDGAGFGRGDQVFGGGRGTRDQFSYSFPFRCMIAKVRLEGSNKVPLKISGINFLYQKGSSMR